MKIKKFNKRAMFENIVDVLLWAIFISVVCFGIYFLFKKIGLF